MKRRSKRAVDEGTVVRIVNEVRVDLPFLGGRKTLFLARTRLREAGVRIGRDRFFDVLRRNGMLVERRRAFVPKTTRCDTSLPISTNLTRGLVVDAPNQVHVSDITYIRVGDGFAYLSLVSDRFCRDIVGWCLSPDLTASGPVSALKMSMRVVPHRPPAHDRTPIVVTNDKICG